MYTCKKGCGFETKSMREMSNHYQNGCNFKRFPTSAIIAVFIALIGVFLLTSVSKASAIVEQEWDGCDAYYIVRINEVGRTLTISNANILQNAFALNMTPTSDGLLEFAYVDETLDILTNGDDGYVDTVNREIGVTSIQTITFNFVMTSTIVPDFDANPSLPGKFKVFIDGNYLTVGRYIVETIPPLCILDKLYYMPIVHK